MSFLHTPNLTATLALNLFGKIQKKQLIVKNVQAIVYKKIGWQNMEREIKYQNK